MRPLITFSVVPVLALAVSLPLTADDQQKAEKQTQKITAMATDSNARRTVSMTISDVLGITRRELLRERRRTGLNYGALFIAENREEHLANRRGARRELEEDRFRSQDDEQQN